MRTAVFVFSMSVFNSSISSRILISLFFLAESFQVVFRPQAKALRPCRVQDRPYYSLTLSLFAHLKIAADFPSDFGAEFATPPRPFLCLLGEPFLCRHDIKLLAKTTLKKVVLREPKMCSALTRSLYQNPALERRVIRRPLTSLEHAICNPIFGTTLIAFVQRFFGSFWLPKSPRPTGQENVARRSAKSRSQNRSSASTLRANIQPRIQHELLPRLSQARRASVELILCAHFGCQNRADAHREPAGRAGRRAELK